MRFLPLRFVVLSSILVGCLALAVSRLPAQEASADPGEAVPTPVPAADQQIKEVTDALERFRNLDFDGALAMLKDAATKNPKLAPAEVIMATWFLRANQPRGSRYWLEQAVVEVPDDPEAYIYIASMALSERRMCEASLVFGRASGLVATLGNEDRKKRLEPRIYDGLAAVAGARKDWDTAKTNLEAWLKLEPKSAKALQRLAGVRFQMKDETSAADALAKLKEAYEVDPDKVLFWATQMALLYHQAADKSNAKTWMDYAQKKAAKDLQTQIVVTQWCLETDDLDRAEKLANGAMQLDPNSARAKILRGVIALFKKDYKDAEAYFYAVVVKAPSNFAATNNLALALCEQEEEDKRKLAKEYAENNVRLHQKTRSGPEAASTYGWVLFKNGDVRGADKVLSQLARAGRVSEDTAYFIARVARELGRTDEAKALLQQALKSTRPFSKRDEAQALLKEINR